MKPIWLPVLAVAAVGLLRADDAASKSPAPISQWESGSFSLLPRSFQTHPHIDVVVITEMTKAGKALALPDPAHPTYYFVHDAGLSETGDVIAGERPPSAKGLADVLTSTLAANGYLPSDATHPPTLLLNYRWGSFNQLSSMSDPTGANGPDPNDPPDDLMLQNMIERAALVGGESFAMDVVRAMNAGTLSMFENKDAHTTWLMQQVYSNRYFVIATAYDIKAAMQQQAVILWRTKISTDSQGVTMDESLPTLVTSSGPFFGRETAGPVRLNRPVAEGNVEIGTPVVKGFSDSVTPSGQPAPPVQPK